MPLNNRVLHIRMPDSQTFGNQIKRYGWRPDRPDHRDYYYTSSKPVVTPPHKDLRPALPPCYDQGDLGSCTGNAIAGILHYNEICQKKAPYLTPSRLFIYYNERVIDGTITEDAGSTLRHGIQAVSRWGYCAENDWPYDIARFADVPSDSAYGAAKKEIIKEYMRVNQNLNDLRAVIASGHPVTMGFSVYESFESREVRDTGIVPMPGLDEQDIGGHAVLLVGYDDPSSRFIVRNSWGSDWGDNGYFTIPYEYVLNNDLADDFWTIRVVP